MASSLLGGDIHDRGAGSLFAGRGVMRRPPALRHRPRRVGSAWLAQAEAHLEVFPRDSSGSLAKNAALRRASSRVSRLVAELAAYLSVAMYAARSAASMRDSSMSGIFGCGASRNRATLAASKPGIFAIVANGGA